MPVIYLDVLIALNMFIDFLLLSCTARLLRIPYRRGRFVLSAVFGGGCSCFIFLPDSYSLLLFFLKIASAGIIIRIAFRWQTVLGYIKQLTVFLVTSALFAGIAFAVWFFAAPSGFYVVNGVVYYNVSPLLLTALTVVSYIAISIYDRFTHKKVAPNRDYHLLVDCEGGPAELRALYDTGHHVTDVFTGVPVVIADYTAMKPFLPEELLSAIQNAFTAGRPDISPSSQDTATAAAVKTRLRMIPFRSVNGTGLLPAFRPRRMALTAAHGISRDITGTYLALTNSLARGDYEAIIGTDIVNILEGSQIKCKH